MFFFQIAKRARVVGGRHISQKARSFDVAQRCFTYDELAQSKELADINEEWIASHFTEKLHPAQRKYLPEASRLFLARVRRYPTRRKIYCRFLRRGGLGFTTRRRIFIGPQDDAESHDTTVAHELVHLYAEWTGLESSVEEALTELYAQCAFVHALRRSPSFATVGA